MWDAEFRLSHFAPGLLVPPASHPSLFAGFLLLLLSIYSRNINNAAWLLLRLAITPLAIRFFWDHGFGPYETSGNQIAVGMAVMALYGIARVLETNVISLFDERPPVWVSKENGKPMPLPTSFLGRLAYALDDATTLRGTSWFADRHWEWAPRALVPVSSSAITRGAFLRRAFFSLLKQYLMIDALDTFNKSRRWDLSTPYPISSLPLPHQLAFSLSVCTGTVLAITFMYTPIAATAVALGASPVGWPPMFDSPFTASSLADFWARRWHAIFRRVFARFTSVPLRFISLPEGTAYAPARAAVRALLTFALSASLHILLMYRLDLVVRGDTAVHVQRTFLDPAILTFFLAQPLGLAVEALVVIPLARLFLTERWRTAATRVWAWCFLLWVGRYWADVWVHRGLWGENEHVVGYSVVRGVLWGKWTV